MSFFIRQSPDPRSEMWNSLGQSVGQGLADFTGNYFASKDFNKVLNDPNMKNASPSDRLQALLGMANKHGERGKSMLAQQLGIEGQRQQETQKKSLSQALELFQKGEDIPPHLMKDQPPELQLKLRDMMKSQKIGNSVAQNLKQSGMDEELADYYGQMIASTEKGTGQTYAIKAALDAGERYGQKPQFSPYTQQAQEFSEINPTFRFPEPEKMEGRTPKEIADIKQKNAQDNIKADMENRQVRRNIQSDKFDYQKLQNLNPYISTGFSKWHINPKTGEPVIAAAANAQEREFSKIIVNQLRKAKDTFGSRVTNFDAQKYLEGFPSLADNPQARSAVIKDLQKVNEINNIYSKALDEVYRTYKKDAISPSEAERIAEDIAMNDVERLYEQYAEVSPEQSSQNFDILPNPSQYQGRTIKNNDTGQVLRSDGKRWIPQ